MLIPDLPAPAVTRDSTTVFAGLRLSGRPADGEFVRTENLSTDRYPLLAPRRPRAVAAALTGTITDPQTLGPMPAVTLPEQFRIDDSAVLPPAPADEADAVEVLRGPNIQPFPQSRPFADTLTAELVLKVGDNITTDHIMPAGAKILPYRSNIPKLAEFCFTVCDPTFPARAITTAIHPLCTERRPARWISALQSALQTTRASFCGTFLMSTAASATARCAKSASAAG